MRTAALLLAATAWSCTKTARIEVGIRTMFDGDPVLRVGVSGGIGLSNVDATFAATQAVGYRYVERHAVTTTTRVLARTGPVYTSGSLEIDDDAGLDLAPGLAVPVYRSWSEPRELGQKLTEQAHLVSVGIQVRVGRHDGETTVGADLVIAYDELGDTSNFASP